MADEIVEPSEGGNSRRNLILLGVAAFFGGAISCGNYIWHTLLYRRPLN